MAATVLVLLPGVLRAVAAGSSQLEVELATPATLADLLDELKRRQPALERRLRDERGRLRRYVNFFVDGEECRALRGSATPLPAGARVDIIPSVAGG